MKSRETTDVRMTDDLERKLLQEAIDSQFEYALDRAFVQFFYKLFSVFKMPKGHVRHAVHTAH